MNGLVKSEYISNQTLRKVTESIEKSRSTKIYIDFSKEIKKKAKKIRDQTKKLLTEWISQNYIKGFEEYKEGKSFKGITIII